MNDKQRITELEDTLKKIKFSLKFMIKSIQQGETPLKKQIILSCLESICEFFDDIKL